MTFLAATFDEGLVRVRGQSVPGSDGNLCVHRTLEPMSCGWSLSHVPTGCAFRNDFATSDDAHAFAQRFLRECDRRYLRMKDPRAFVRRMRAAFRRAGV